MSDAVEECKCEKGAPKWMVTFGDMMSLLLCFFVLLLSFSTTDVIKYKQMVGSMKDAFGIAESDPAHNMPEARMQIIPMVDMPRTMSVLVSIRAKAAQMAKSSSELEMESGADWVRIKVPGDALFPSGSFEILPEAAPLLDGIGDLINDFEGKVFIEGHTDGDPPGTTRFPEGSWLGNYELGAMRSISVVGYLVRKKSVDKTKLVPTSLGQEIPRESNQFDQGKALNRRVEFEFRGAASAINSDVGEVIKP